MLKSLRQRDNRCERTFQTLIFVWTTNTKNLKTKPSYIYSTTTNQNTFKDNSGMLYLTSLLEGEK